MLEIWKFIERYYTILGRLYHVNPVIFLGIHVAATPVFIFCITWLVSNHRRKKNIVFPLVIMTLVFNAANIYLIVFGRNIPWYIYAILLASTLVSGYFSYRKIKRKIQN